MTKPAGQLAQPKYRPDIDGLRAIAVLSVVAFHAFPRQVPGGFVGVDVFFVISGFLITSIIVSNLERDTFSFFEFYRRRVQRIFPSLLVVLAASLFVGWFVLLADEYRQLGKHVAAGAGFSSNIVLFNESGYFDPSAQSKPLLHLWSLGIEEQFYLVWPALVWLAWRTRLNLIQGTLTVCLISFMSNLILMRANLTAAFYLPPPRFWELLVGAALACAAHRHSAIVDAVPRTVRHAASISGILLVAASIFAMRTDLAFPGWWVLLPTLGAMSVVLAGPDVGLNQRVLSNPALVWVGKISFPLYLWHWPLLSFARIIEGDDLSWSARVGFVALSILLAWLTCRWVENPLRFGLRSGVKALGLSLAMVIIGVAGYTCFTMRGMPTRRVARITRRFGNLADDWTYEEPQLTNGSLSIVPLSGTRAERVLFIGDSLMGQYFPRIALLYARAQGRPAYSAVLAAKPGCRPVPRGERINTPGRHCDEYYRAAMALAREPLYTRVVVAANWETVLSDLAGGDNQAALTADLAQLSASGKGLYLVAMNPHSQLLSPAVLAKPYRLGFVTGGETPHATTSLDRWRVAGDRESLRRFEAFAARVGATIVDPYDTFCSAERCMAMDGNVPLYTDNYHLRAQAVRKYATFLDPLVGTP